MESEKELAGYATKLRYRDLPDTSVSVIKNMVLTVLGTTIAGAAEEGCKAMVDLVREWGGKEEATIFVYGGKAPAHNVAAANSVMARALDFCDAMSPGIHLGSSVVPTAYAIAELMAGCSGEDFIAHLAAATELAARINAVSDYDGFDPTGVCGVFAATVVAGRMLGLNPEQMLHALALAFNRAGGSFQSNVDGALAVRVIQGFVSQNGIICAQLAKRGISGPRNFLKGIYGYLHLYGRASCRPVEMTKGLGEVFRLNDIIFKKYPSCGCTLASTDAALDLIGKENFRPEHILRVDIRVSPYAYKLAGHPFELGENLKVNAQFSIQYCIANALIRKTSKLVHFDKISVMDEKVLELIKKIYVHEDINLGVPGIKTDKNTTHLSVKMKVTTLDGNVYYKAVDLPRGNPVRPLSNAEHFERFYDCISYSKYLISNDRAAALCSRADGLEKVSDVRTMIPLLMQTENEFPEEGKERS
ncbi:MmgE/PrpD family protein [uncultured Desulfatiglans sp.]|nr:MmgE/PrpD family protein [uncultured Desulfatiglans sp.]